VGAGGLVAQARRRHGGRPLTAGEAWPVALLATTGVHLGFQATVTLLVYPSLARVPAADFPAAHDLHSRRITPLVAVVYGAVLVACIGAVSTSPRAAGPWLAAAGTALAFVVTAVAAAPTHGRLGRARSDDLVRRLLVVDRLRLVGAVLALAGAVLAAGAAVAG
jgi:hypothetical protein